MNEDKKTDPATTLTIVCMYCNEEMGTQDGKGQTGETGSICRFCWRKYFPQYPYPEEK